MRCTKNVEIQAQSVPAARHQATRGGARRGRRERGTVLLMVVGVLALLSIIAVAYVSIGQTDRRGAGVFVRAQRLDDQRDAIAGYINGVLTRDVFSTVYDPVVPATSSNPASGVYRTIRAAWDYPKTDIVRRMNRQRVGNFPSPDPAPGAAIDQWLVVSRIQPNSPEVQRYVQFQPSGYGDDPWLASAKPTAIAMTPAPTIPGYPHAANEAYRDVQGWMQLTNVAPNGQFVNIGTLRPTTQNPRGNFQAAAGVAAPGPTGSPDPAQRSAQMSWALSLFDNTGVLQTNLNSVDLADGTPADRNIPAHWSTNQAFLFRPAKELASDNSAVGPDSLLYLPYQFADADGDGFFDSRWFELSNGSNGEAAIPGLSFSGPARLFCAARIIDLSGMVNVNTASDFRGLAAGGGGPAWTGPEENYLAGMYPSDVDLTRVLRQVDAIDAYGTGYADILQKVPGTATASPLPLSDYTGYDANVNGALAFDNIWQNNLVGYATTSPVTGQERTFAYTAFGKDPGGARFHAEVATGNVDQYTLGTPFDMGDQAELLTRFGVNDPSHISRLETLVDGQTPTSAGGDPRGPMRSNRPLSLEISYRTALGPTGNTLATDGLPHETSLLQLGSDVRSMLTTISGHRPIMVSDLTDALARVNRIDDKDLTLNLADTLRVATSQDVNAAKLAKEKIFLAYANALMPALPQVPSPAGGGGPMNDEAWIFAGPQWNNLKGMFYGWRGPELGLRLSAFMTANLIDMYDRPAGAGSLATDKQTGLIVKQLRNSFGSPGNVAGYTEVNLGDAEDNAGVGNRNRLAPASATGVASEFRAFGTEAQPFITQVAALDVYTDAPYPRSTSPATDPEEGWRWIDTNGNGQVDTGGIPPGNPGDVIWTTPSDRGGGNSINGAIDGGNPDFLFQVVAFQLHNPFNVEVSLSGYTLQYGNSRYPLPTTTNAILAPGETRTFYITNPIDEAAITSRLTAVQGVGAAGTWPPSLAQWLRKQMHMTSAGTNSLVKLQERYKLNGATQVSATAVDDLLADRALADNLGNFTALLWRSLSAGAAVPGTNNDLLADRLRDPNIPDDLNSIATARATLDRRMSGIVRVQNTIAGPDPHLGSPPNLSEAKDNTGYTIALWGSVRRAIDPGAGAVPTIPVGAIPAYCIEVKDQSGANWRVNKAEDDQINLGSPNPLDKSDFTGGRNCAFTTAAAAFDAATVPTFIDSLVLEPKNKGTSIGTAIRDSGDPADATTAREYRTIYPEIHLKNDRFQASADFDGPAPGGPLPAAQFTTMRIGDTLLPMAIGAWWEPAPGATGTNQPPNYSDLRRIDDEWTTLSEALALALDYDTPKDRYGGNDPRPRLFNRFGRDIVDRGHLRVDKFVPFYNDGSLPNNPEGDFAPDAPALAGYPVVSVVSPGIPLALNVLEQFRAMEYGSESARINGTINANTAEVNVLRTLPLMTPEKGSWMELATMTTSAVGGSAPVTQPLFNSATEHYDVATTLAAYRDKALLQTRSLGAAGGTNTYPIDFAAGRYVRNGIPGIREGAGLHSAGEILCATLRPAAGAADTDPDLIDNSIDRFGRRNTGTADEKFYFNDRGTGSPGPLTGLDTCAYPSSALGSNAPDQIAGDWDKKLTIANAVLNTVSVRSDVFCVYFVVQGYLPSDVEGFDQANGPAFRQAMVPSVNRRFMMVVDRSNVRTPSDKPRILLLREVPL